MRHIIIAILIMVAILSLGIYEQYLIGDVMEHISIEAEEIVKCLKIDDKANALQECDTLLSYWEKHRGALESFFLHTELKDIPIDIAELHASIETSSIEDAIVCARKLIASSREHIHSLAFEYQNIL